RATRAHALLHGEEALTHGSGASGEGFLQRPSKLRRFRPTRPFPSAKREMTSRTPTIINLNAEVAKLAMFRGRTPRLTLADRQGSAARLASYRDGALTATKFSGKAIGKSTLPTS